MGEALPQKTHNFRQMDVELVDAWFNTVEAKQQIETVGNELKSRTSVTFSCCPPSFVE
jgi:hypothetical protein